MHIKLHVAMSYANASAFSLHMSLAALITAVLWREDYICRHPVHAVRLAVYAKLRLTQSSKLSRGTAASFISASTACSHFTWCLLHLLAAS